MRADITTEEVRLAPGGPAQALSQTTVKAKIPMKSPFLLIAFSPHKSLGKEQAVYAALHYDNVSASLKQAKNCWR
jgi:hypothetical protein